MASRKNAAVARVAALRYWRARDARLVVEAWKQSGEPLGTFVERYGLHARRVRRWATQLEEQAEPVRFHPVQLVQGTDGDRRDGESLEIVLGTGCTVRVPAGFAAEDLERVLEVLGVGC